MTLERGFPWKNKRSSKMLFHLTNYYHNTHPSSVLEKKKVKSQMTGHIFGHMTCRLQGTISSVVAYSKIASSTVFLEKKKDPLEYQ